MPYKRTRSAAVERPDGNSSNVTDYMGPPATKRQKSANNTSPIVTRSSQAALARGPAKEPQSKAAPTRRKATTPQRVEEEADDDADDDDDDDGSVHVAFNQVSSAVNEARLGQPRTINGLGDVTEGEEARQLAVRKRGQPSKARAPQNQQSRPQTRSRAKEVWSADIDIYEMPTPEPEKRAQPIQASAEEEEEEDPDSEQDMQAVAAQAGDDSAFIDAPRADEKLPEVTHAVHSLGGIIKTLSHSAWTGVKNWDEDPDMACSTKTAGQLIEHLRQLNDLLLEAYEARYEGGADGDPAATIDYLRRKSAKLKEVFTVITALVDQICARKLAAVDNLDARGVTTRKRIMRDILKRLLPMVVLVIQKAYDVGPSEDKGSVVHLTLNSFTVQFPLRAIGWAIRLAEVLSRGLMRWPIDQESSQSDEELDIVQAAQKKEKLNKREQLGTQLTSLYSAVKKAADALNTAAREAQQTTRQEQDRRQAMVRGRELWAREEQKRQEAKQSAEEQMERFVQALQNLKPVPNPLAELWKQAGLSHQAPAASAALAASQAPVSRRNKAKEKAAHAHAHAHFGDDDEFFLTHDDEGRPLESPGIHRSKYDGVRKTGQGLPLAQRREAWGAPRWSKAEEKKLVRRMQSDKAYNPSTIAPRLGRAAEDVARKAAELKAVYRAIYRNRGATVPIWAW